MTMSIDYGHGTRYQIQYEYTHADSDTANGYWHSCWHNLSITFNVHSNIFLIIIITIIIIIITASLGEGN